jgi:hypothetical protein
MLTTPEQSQTMLMADVITRPSFEDVGFRSCGSVAPRTDVEPGAWHSGDSQQVRQLVREARVPERSVCTMRVITFARAITEALESVAQ